jgi:hypothetical protein
MSWGDACSHAVAGLTTLTADDDRGMRLHRALGHGWPLLHGVHVCRPLTMTVALRQPVEQATLPRSRACQERLQMAGNRAWLPATAPGWRLASGARDSV